MNGVKKKQLVISTHRGRWRNRAGGEPADKEFEKIKPTILAKDAHRCVYCGLRMEGKGPDGNAAMEVHHEDCNHENNNPKNLHTADHFCHAYNHIGFLGKMGVLAYIPDVSIEDMNNLLRTLAVAMATGDEAMKNDAAEIFEELRSMSAGFANTWGTANPADIGNALLALPESAYSVRDIVLSGVRIVFDIHHPVNRRFGETAAAKAHAGIPIASWDDIANEYLMESPLEWAAARASSGVDDMKTTDEGASEG